MNEPIIQIQSVYKSYRVGEQDVEILRGVSLDVPPQKLSALVGPSGSGKSTLLNILAGLDTADSGSVRVCGEHLFGLNREELASFRLNSLGIVFQFFNLLPTLTLLQNVELPGVLRRGRASEIRERGMTLLKQVGLEEKATRLPNELSGGEMQRGAIARALMNRPKLILADEPTGNLDTHNGAMVLDIFEKLVEAEQVSALIVTHDPSVVQRATHHFEIADGVIRP